MDRSTRQAALWATAVALPAAIVVALLMVNRLTPDQHPAAAPTRAAPQATSPVEMAAPPLPARAATVCRALLSQLPPAVRDRPQRPVTAGPEQNAAYGDPPITLACGIATASFPPTDYVYPLSGVCWHAEERTDDVVWTTVDREVPVRVTVPRTYESPGQWVIAFSDPVAASVRSLPRVPAGCTRAQPSATPS